MGNVIFRRDTYLNRPTTYRLLISVVIAIIANALVTLIAHRAGANAGFLPLTPPLYLSFTVVGFAAGWIGWRIIEVRVAHPRKVLAILVPVITILSFTPDTFLLLLRFIPNTTTTGVIGLMAMHLVVVACAVPAYIFASRQLKIK